MATPRKATDAAPAIVGAARPVSLADVERVVGLERELETLRLRLIVTRLVVRDMIPRVSDDDESLGLIIDDVLRRWQERDPDDEPAELGGPDGFWNRYANRVEFAPPGGDDEYRAEFCPREPEHVDIDDYYEAVWRTHVAELRATARTGTAVS